MARPDIDMNPALHGMLKEFGDRHDIDDLTELYELAAGTLATLDPEAMYQPGFDAPVTDLLDGYCERDD